MEDLSIFHPDNLFHTQETMSRYRPGGFHPISLGDTFQDGRYKIYHKLGWGGSSTVWLAKDNKCEQWVSIKIMTADRTNDSHELSILRSLAACSHGHPSSKYIVQLLDEFLHLGPNGSHQCLVFELVGPTLDMVVNDYQSGGDLLEPEDVVRLSEQLLQAIAFLHEVGCVHGDISGRNVAFTCNNLSRKTEEDLFEILGRPETVEVTRLDGKPLSRNLPRQLVKAADWVDWTEEDEEDLRIIDFGEASIKGSETRKLAQPCSLQAPETIFTSSFDYRLDLWRAGILLHSLIFGTIPFQQWGGLETLVAQMINFVEELPSEWQQQWDHMQQSSKLRVKLVDEESQSSPSKLESKFDKLISKEILTPFLCVIQGFMRFRPSDRISTSEALDLIRSIAVES